MKQKRKSSLVWLLCPVLLAALCVGVLLLSAVEPFAGAITQVTASEGYGRAATEEIEAHILSVGETDGSTKLVVGDSVCWQVFDPYHLCNPDYRIDASNRAVTLAGQYLLMLHYLENHPDAADVYLIVGPESFSADFDANYGYQYAVIPFSEAGLLSRLDGETQALLDDAYHWPMLCPPVVTLVDHSNLCRKLYLNLLQDDARETAAQAQAEGLETGEPSLNALSTHMLEQMETLCAAHGAAFHLLAAPVSDDESRTAAMETLRAEFEAAGLYERYESYFTTVSRYPAADFSDGIHFNSETCGMEYFARVIEDMKTATGLMGGLVTDYNA